jgi:NTE family protein
MKSALVLGGGGARGLAHVGVLKVLEKENIKFDMIIGCSFGALVGGMYAQTPDFEVVERRLRFFSKSKEYKDLGVKMVQRPSFDSEAFISQFARNIRDRVLLNVIINKISILRAERLANAIKFLIKDGLIENTTIPFFCNATDLVSGRPYLFKKGSIRAAIKASTTIPGYFPPVEIGNKKLVDGAVTHNLPIRFAKALGATFIIAVDVHPPLHDQEDFRSVFDVILRSNTITSTLLSEEFLNESDIMLRPDVGEYMWYDFDKGDEVIAKGEKATIDKVEEIQNGLQRTHMGVIRKFFRQKLKLRN